MELSEVQTVADFLNEHPQLLPILSIIRQIQDDKPIFTWHDILSAMSFAKDGEPIDMKEYATAFINYYIAKTLAGSEQKTGFILDFQNISDLANALEYSPTE